MSNRRNQMLVKRVLLVWNPRLGEHFDPKTGATLSDIRKAVRAYGYDWRTSELPTRRAPHVWLDIFKTRGWKR